MNFLAELKRRNVIRMAGLYLVGAWLITQVASTLLPVFEAPGWVMKTIVGILALGFIPAMVFAWIFELTPEGLKRDAEVTPEQSVAPQTARRMERSILVLFAIALTFFGFDKFYLAPKREAAAINLASETVKAQTLAKIKTSVSEKSIAVLPFVNMSADKDAEYFSDGVAEEILNALAKVDDLKVAGRTSSFYFKGRNETLAAIGSTLGVAHLLEGSVRKQGERLRISAKLLRISDGVEMWADTFDGTDADIFALQEKIAQQVTRQLKVALNAGQQGRLVDIGTSDPDAYELYLQASAIFNRREGERFTAAIEMLERALQLDPNFARAHARLGALQAIASQYTGVNLNQSMAAAIQHANAAIAIDPNLAEAYAVLAQSQGAKRQFVAQRQSYERALSIDSDDVLSNFWMGSHLVNTGYYRLGDGYLDRALAVDPLLPNALHWRGSRYAFMGDLEAGERMLRRANEFGLSNVGLGLSYLEQARGNEREAIAHLARALEVFMSAFPDGTAQTVAEGSFGDARQRARALRMIDDYLAKKPEVVAGAVPYALIRLGEPKRGLEVMLQGPTDTDALVFFLLFSPLGAETRKLPEFPAFVRDIGLSELWDVKGPPDHCRKNDKGNYVCE